MAVKRIAGWVALVSPIIAVLALIPAYYVFWAKPDLAYEEQLVNIPLPETFGTNLPNVLVLLKIQNAGHRPSENIQGNMSVSGQLLYYEVHGPNPAYGQVAHTKDGSGISITCPRLAPGEFPITISAWYRGKFEEPDAGFSDSFGPARKVKSIVAEENKLRWYLLVVLDIMVALIALVVCVVFSRRLNLMYTAEQVRVLQLQADKEGLRKQIEELARRSKTP